MTEWKLRGCFLLLALLPLPAFAPCSSRKTKITVGRRGSADARSAGSQPPPPSPHTRFLAFFENRTPSGRLIPGLAKNSKCCGFENDDSRIFGGIPALRNQFPWMAFIAYYCSEDIKGGGSLLNDRYVLTSGSIFIGRRRASSQLTREGLEVILGRHEQTVNSGNDLRIYVEQVIIHPDFNPPFPYNNIALLKLETPLQLPIQGNLIAPICMPTRGTYTNKQAVMAGWGSASYQPDTNRNGGGREANASADHQHNQQHHQQHLTRNEMPDALPDRLYHVTLRTISNSRCNSLLQPSLFAIQQSLICAAGEDIGADKGFCDYDGGGPLMVSPWYLKNRKSVVGVASSSRQCYEPDPLVRIGVYTRVTSYLDWLIENMPDAKYC